MDSGWAWLPEHLLDSIFIKLINSDSATEAVLFGAVCKQWYSAAATHQHGRTLTLTKKPMCTPLPLLLVPTRKPNTSTSSTVRRCLYSLTKNKLLHDLQLPAPFDKRRCCGSCYGWLAFAEDNLAVTLVNPFTGATVYLPPIPKFREDDYFMLPIHEYDIDKVILSADPCMTSDYEVIAIFTGGLSFIRPGRDMAWTRMFKKEREIVDVVYYKGDLVAVSNLGEVARFITRNSKFNNKRTRSELVEETLCYCDRSYLAESTRGDLLMVRRFLEYNELTCQKGGTTRRFDVYIINISASALVQVDDLGGDALFLGDNCSITIDAVAFNECFSPGSGADSRCIIPNSIYFTDEFLVHSDFLQEDSGPCDTGVFKLEDGSIEKHYTPEPSHNSLPPPIWVVPKLNFNLSGC